jgi:hypothetical protein
MNSVEKDGQLLRLKKLKDNFSNLVFAAAALAKPDFRWRREKTVEA